MILSAHLKKKKKKTTTKQKQNNNIIIIKYIYINDNQLYKLETTTV